MPIATVRNAEPLPLIAIPVLEIAVFRRVILEGVAGGRRLLFLGGIVPHGATRLLAALADDRGGEIGLFATDVTSSYPALTPECPSAHYFEREIFEQFEHRAGRATPG